MRIKHIIIILFIFLSVIPLVSLGTTNIIYYNDKIEKILENDLKIAVSTQVKAIENFYEERKMDAQVIMGYQIVGDLLTHHEPGPERKKLRKSVEDLLLSRITSNRFIESITLLDTDFHIVACTEETSDTEISDLKQIDPKYLSREMKFTHVIDIKRKGRNERVLAAVQEIYQGEQRLGYLAMELNLAFFEEVRESSVVFNNGTIYLLDNNERMITAGDTVSTRENFELSPAERTDYVRAWNNRDPNSRDGILRYTARGDHYISCYSYFDHMDWTIISSVNSDEVIQTRAVYRDLALIIAMVLVVLLIAVNYFISRNIAVPIGNMIERFRLIRETHDYSIRMKYLSNNEIGVISSEIDSLLSDIESYIEMEKKKQEQLKEKAERDPLTGLFNKDTMERLIRIELDRTWLEKKPMAVLFLDIDDFKSFNTLHGHIGGDKILCFVAEQLKKFTNGMAGRQGGDEFVACISNIRKKDLDTTLKKMLETLNRGKVLEDGSNPIPIGCSVGAVFSNGEKISYEDLLIRADEAMYAIKQKEKNGYLIWDISEHL